MHGRSLLTTDPLNAPGTATGAQGIPAERP